MTLSRATEFFHSNRSDVSLSEKIAASVRDSVLGGSLTASLWNPGDGTDKVCIVCIWSVLLIFLGLCNIVSNVMEVTLDRLSLDIVLDRLGNVSHVLRTALLDHADDADDRDYGDKDDHA